ncbi:AMP-binding protein [Rhizobium leguminosarum bv. viciae]|nr:AMP-binding protein [Rhizobium leguminosarum bv. viciae]
MLQLHQDPVPTATIAELWSMRAARDPHHVYCTFGGDVWTIGRMHERSNRIANGLLGEFSPGSRVALMLPNDPEYAAVIFGLAKAGLVRIPINVHLKDLALEFVFDRFEPHALIADVTYRTALVPVLEKFPQLTVIWRDASLGDVCALNALSMAAGAHDPEVGVTPDTIIAITPSSGTTGEPKGVLKSDLSLRAGPLGIIALTDADAGDVLLHWEPLYHGAGVAVLIAAVMRPLKLVMISRFSASRFWQQIADDGVTLIHYLGGVLQILLAQARHPAEDQHKVRLAWGGGCSAEVWKRFTERFGIPMHEGYGLSEATTFVTINRDGPAGSCGVALPFYDVRLRDDNNGDDPDVGELLIRPKVSGLEFRGYYGRPNSVAELVTDGWFATGDLMRRDREGYFYYAGRLKDSVRRRGVNISSWEVERVFQAHEEVEECALIGVPGEFGDDDLKLFVKRSEGASISEGELVSWAKERMPYFQLPRYLTFIEAFDKTPTQRIIKATLSKDTVACFDYEAEVGRISGKR